MWRRDLGLIPLTTLLRGRVLEIEENPTGAGCHDGEEGLVILPCGLLRADSTSLPKCAVGQFRLDFGEIDERFLASNQPGFLMSFFQARW